MTFEEYQKRALETDDSVGAEMVSAQLFAILLGLSGEVGEVMEKFKKIYWHRKGAEWTEEDRVAISKELGDMLWYLSSISNHVGVPLSKIAEDNLEKLKSRNNRGVLRGNGDNR